MATEVLQVPASEFDKVLKFKQVDGWTLDHLTDDYADLSHWGDCGNIWVHLILFILTFWWSFGIINMLYLMLARFGGSYAMKLVKVND